MLLRRSSSTSAPTDAPAAVDLVKSGGKGRPTPKRSEAAKQRRQAVRAPVDRKEASRMAREKSREARATRMEALKRGDESALPARDRGPVKRHVRDLVDSRFNVAEIFMPVVVVVLLLSLVRPLAAFGVWVWAVMLLLGIADSVVLRQRIKRSLAERFPGQSTKGAVGYGVLRALQMRPLRMPKPRVARGQTRA
ncbi:DUF3043 family protein [Motilibacter rhizosphaerae]|uniref:DUF3043 family protein n=1 Tax=Motilibacter rhizosphaerae TaxID=598652 RepID=A0A4Q7NR80_9ACTN|nr:DUF3043 domain-containing protein [Motilibacter rhizosphaerae]RZS89573.1 DUF3043 family protein [Motilibacter rhizosphaerae]